MMYSNLSTFGCSYTYGDELSDFKKNPLFPSKLAWPNKLSEYLNIPNVNNYAQQGASNDCIARTIVKKLGPCYPPTPLVGIMWTHFERIEYIGTDGKWCNILPSGIDGVGHEKWIKEYYKNTIEDNGYYNFYKNVHYISMYLESHNINYFMLMYRNYIVQDTEQSDAVSHLSYLKEKFTLINDSFNTFARHNNYTQGPEGHYLDDAHADWVKNVLGPEVKRKCF